MSVYYCQTCQVNHDNDETVCVEHENGLSCEGEENGLL